MVSVKNHSCRDKKVIFLFLQFTEKEEIKNRYILVMRYLRGLVPRFQISEFAETFAKFLDAIEREVAKTKQNAEMIKALSTSVVTSTSNNSPVNRTVMSSSEAAVVDVEDDGVPHKIELDISMDIGQNLGGDDSNELPTLKSISHTGQTSIDSYFTGSDNSKSPFKQQPNHAIFNSPSKKINFTGTDRKRKAPKVTENITKKPASLKLKEDPVLQNQSATLSQPQPQPSPSLQETNSRINPTNDELSPRKKPRLDIDNDNVENEVTPAVDFPPAPVPKPTVNAFALLMSRSKEVSGQKKQQKKIAVNKSNRRK